MASKASEQMLGYDRGELVGMHVNDVLFERKFIEEMRDELDEKGRMMVPSRFVSKKGETIPVNLTASVLRSERGRSLGYVVVGTKLFTTDRPTRVSVFSPPAPDEPSGSPAEDEEPDSGAASRTP